MSEKSSPKEPMLALLSLSAINEKPVAQVHTDVTQQLRDASRALRTPSGRRLDRTYLSSLARILDQASDTIERLRSLKKLDNFKRGRVIGYISAKPGTSFTDIRDGLRMANGVLAHHLSVLERLGLVAWKRVGKTKRFFPTGTPVLDTENSCLGRTESRILEMLGKNGPRSNIALSESLGMSRQRIHYNLRLLERRGLVNRDGSLWRATGA
jgi:predicted transcriptional regulator